MFTPKTDVGICDKGPLPEFREWIGFVDYETYAGCLAGSGEVDAMELAGFLVGRIARIVGV